MAFSFTPELEEACQDLQRQDGLLERLKLVAEAFQSPDSLFTLLVPDLQRCIEISLVGLYTPCWVTFERVDWGFTGKVTLDLKESGVGLRELKEILKPDITRFVLCKSLVKLKQKKPVPLSPALNQARTLEFSGLTHPNNTDGYSIFSHIFFLMWRPSGAVLRHSVMMYSTVHLTKTFFANWAGSAFGIETEEHLDPRHWVSQGLCEEWEE